VEGGLADGAVVRQRAASSPVSSNRRSHRRPHWAQHTSAPAGPESRRLHGLTLIFALMNVLNFAHGQMYVFGGFITRPPAATSATAWARRCAPKSLAMTQRICSSRRLKKS